VLFGVVVCNVVIVRRLRAARPAAGPPGFRLVGRRSVVDLGEAPGDGVRGRRVGGGMAVGATSMMCVAASLTFLVCVRRAHGVRRAPTDFIAPPVAYTTAIWTPPSRTCVDSVLVCVPPSVALTVGRAYWSHRPAYVVARTVNNQLLPRPLSSPLPSSPRDGRGRGHETLFQNSTRNCPRSRIEVKPTALHPENGKKRTDRRTEHDRFYCLPH